MKQDTERLFPTSMDNFIPMVYCDESSPDTSHFQFIDSVRIVLTDTNTNVQNIYTAHLSKKENIFEYTWNGSVKKINACERNTINPSNDFKKSNSLTDYRWKLYQNYPNPFN